MRSWIVLAAMVAALGAMACGSDSNGGDSPDADTGVTDDANDGDASDGDDTGDDASGGDDTGDDASGGDDAGNDASGGDDAGNDAGGGDDAGDDAGGGDDASDDASGGDDAGDEGDCGNVPNGAFESRLCFASATVAWGEECQGELQMRTCVDGAWDPDYEDCASTTCTVDEPADCGDTPHNGFEGRTCFTSATAPEGQECMAELQTRTCVNGAWDPDYDECASLTCEGTADGSCDDVPNGGFEARTCFASDSVAAGEECEGILQIRSCIDGAWDPDFESCEFSTCEVLAPADCGDIPHNGFESRLCYASATVPAGEECEGTLQFRTCDNGDWDPDFEACEFTSCTVE